MKILKKIFKIVLIFIVLISIFAFFYLRSFKPQYSGLKKLPGLQNTVNVYFDDYGIPHIYAQNKADLYYAFGYIHAQDRLFQMEILRRIASGRLSEIAGTKTLKYDKFFRTLQVDKKSKEAVKHFFSDNNSDFTTDVKNYLKGVNEYLRNGKTPIEYQLMGIKKEDFTPEDIFNIAGYMAFSFAEGFKSDPMITKIRNTLGEDYLKDIVSSYVPGTERIPLSEDTSADYSVLSNITASVSELTESLPVPFFHGSNSWVLSGSRTKSGKVIFANDAHIAYSQPSVWYEAYLETPDFNLYGNFIAGIPFSLIGHNHDVAWGITMFENDDVNYYFEELNPNNSNEYKVADGWKKFKTVTENIKVKDSADVKILIKTTNRGPFINDVIKGLEDKNPISVFWTYTHQPLSIIQAFYGLNNMHSVKEAEKSVKLINAPGLNIMYGDKNGNIAYWASASILKYKDSVKTDRIESWKNAPVAYYDFKDNPQSVNPPSGFLYSANNQPDSVNGILYPGYYAPEDRAKRIISLINSDSDWTVDKIKKISTDVTSVKAPKIAAEILNVMDKNVLSKSKNHKKVFDILKNWDGNHFKESSAPVIYYRLLRKILEFAMVDELGEKDFDYMTHGHTPARSIPVLLSDDSSVWWDNIKTKNIKETRKDIFTAAFDSTVICLEKELGNDVDNYKWKDVHTVEYKHFIGQASPLLAKIFNVGPFGVWGGREVINKIDFNLSKNGKYQAKSGPSMRIIIDFSDIENSVSIIPTGQSGVFMSKHYADQAQMYNNGKFRKQMMNKKEIISVCKDKLVLEPIEK